MPFIPEYGCFHDYLCVSGNPVVVGDAVEQFALQLVKDTSALSSDPNANVSLAAKWAPSEGSKYDAFARALRSRLHGKTGKVKTMKDYRLYIRNLRQRINSVEEKLSSRRVGEVDFATVPSKAAHRYAPKFKRDDSTRYGEYLSKVVRGEAKMNTAAIEPHKIAEPYIKGRQLDPAVEAAWTAFVSQHDTDKLRGFLPVIDVSYSMTGTPMTVAVTLGILLATLNKGSLHDRWVNFAITQTPLLCFSILIYVGI